MVVFFLTIRQKDLLLQCFFFVFIFTRDTQQIGSFFSSKYVTKSKLVMLHLWFLPLMNDPVIIRVSVFRRVWMGPPI